MNLNWPGRPSANCNFHINTQPEEHTGTHPSPGSFFFNVHYFHGVIIFSPDTSIVSPDRVLFTAREVEFAPLWPAMASALPAALHKLKTEPRRQCAQKLSIPHRKGARSLGLAKVVESARYVATV